MMLLCATVTPAIAQGGPRYSHAGPTMSTGVRVIDGLGGDPKENQNIVVIDELKSCLRLTRREPDGDRNGVLVAAKQVGSITLNCTLKES